MVKQELIKHLLEENRQFIALTETKWNDNHAVTELHNNYNWISKNRSNGKGGEIGFMYKSKNVSLNENNLLNSRSNGLERLWISTKIKKSIVAIDFPIDNVAGLYEDAFELQNELLWNIAELQHSFTNILLIGDFNGKSTDFRKTGKPSSNGVL